MHYSILQMASSGIPGVTMDAVSYIQRALMPDLSAAEAAANFSRMIEESLSNWFVFIYLLICIYLPIFIYIFYLSGLHSGISFSTIWPRKNMQGMARIHLANFCHLFQNHFHKYNLRSLHVV